MINKIFGLGFLLISFLISMEIEYKFNLGDRKIKVPNELAQYVGVFSDLKESFPNNPSVIVDIVEYNKNKPFHNLVNQNMVLSLIRILDLYHKNKNVIDAIDCAWIKSFCDVEYVLSLHNQSFQTQVIDSLQEDRLFKEYYQALRALYIITTEQAHINETLFLFADYLVCPIPLLKGMANLIYDNDSNDLIFNNQNFKNYLFNFSTFLKDQKFYKFFNQFEFRVLGDLQDVEKLITYMIQFEHTFSRDLFNRMMLDFGNSKIQQVSYHDLVAIDRAIINASDKLGFEPLAITLNLKGNPLSKESKNICRQFNSSVSARVKNFFARINKGNWPLLHVMGIPLLGAHGVQKGISFLLEKYLSFNIKSPYYKAFAYPLIYLPSIYFLFNQLFVSIMRLNTRIANMQRCLIVEFDQ